MSKKLNLIIIGFLSLLLVGLVLLRIRLFLDLSEIASAGSVIRCLGETSGDTQVIVKRELNRDPEDLARIEELRKEVTAHLDWLSFGNPEKNIRLLNDRNYQEELSRLFMHWKKLETMIEICRTTKGNELYLFMLSIEFHSQSKRTLEVAEAYLVQTTKQEQRNQMVEFMILILMGLTLIFWFYAGVLRNSGEPERKSFPQ